MTRTVEEGLWANAIECAAFGVWDLDPRLDAVHYSPQWKARLGFPRIGEPDSSAFWRCRVHPDDFPPMLRSLRAHLDGRSPTYEMRFRLRINGAGYRRMVSRGRVVARDAQGQATRMVGTMIDLQGNPATALKAGLAADVPEPAASWPCLPFHAVLGVAEPPAGDARRHLVDRVGDLLDIARREAAAAR